MTRMSESSGESGMTRMSEPPVEARPRAAAGTAGDIRVRRRDAAARPCDAARPFKRQGRKQSRTRLNTDGVQRPPWQRFGLDRLGPGHRKRSVARPAAAQQSPGSPCPGRARRPPRHAPGAGTRRFRVVEPGGPGAGGSAIATRTVRPALARSMQHTPPCPPNV